MKAMILAAGFGTRLFPLTIDRTKPAIPFLGKPLVGYVAEYVARFGFKDIIVNLHHQPESVIKALGDGSRFGVKINYTLEKPEILGTGGGLFNARHFFEDETILVVNGKIITDIDIAAAVETHKKTGALATMVLKENAKREKFTEIFTENEKVSGFGGFPEQVSNAEKEQIRNPKSEIRNPLMFTGIYLLEPRVFEYVPPGVYSDIVSVFFRPAIKKGEFIAAHVAEGSWYELSTIPRYLDISLAMLNGQKEKIVKGENVRISPSSIVKNSVIWDDVIIGDKAEISKVIVADDVKIPAGRRYENAAIVRAEMLEHADEIPEKALQGYVDGENYIVPLDQ